MSLTCRNPSATDASERVRPCLPGARFASALLAVLCIASSAVASAAGWEPTKSLRLILPYAPGGTTDLIARIVAVPLGKELGQQIVIDNRGGGGGLIAMSLVARAQPD